MISQMEKLMSRRRRIKRMKRLSRPLTTMMTKMISNKMIWAIRMKW
jgi:hypothetical protein